MNALPAAAAIVAILGLPLPAWAQSVVPPDGRSLYPQLAPSTPPMLGPQEWTLTQQQSPSVRKVVPPATAAGADDTADQAVAPKRKSARKHRAARSHRAGSTRKSGDPSDNIADQLNREEAQRAAASGMPQASPPASQGTLRLRPTPEGVGNPPQMQPGYSPPAALPR